MQAEVPAYHKVLRLLLVQAVGVLLPMLVQLTQEEEEEPVVVQAVQAS